MVNKKAGEMGERVRQVMDGATQFDIAFTFGFTLLAATALGYYGGLFLDERLGTDPYLMVTGILLGIIASFRILVRDLLGEDVSDAKPKEEDDEPERDEEG